MFSVHGNSIIVFFFCVTSPFCSFCLGYLTREENTPLLGASFCCVILDGVPGVCVPFSFDILGRMWISLISILDDCLFIIYFAFSQISHGATVLVFQKILFTINAMAVNCLYL